MDSTNPAVLSVSVSGAATAAPVGGESILQAAVTETVTRATPYASREVVVLPPGTYRLVGRVTEAVRWPRQSPAPVWRPESKPASRRRRSPRRPPTEQAITGSTASRPTRTSASQAGFLATTERVQLAAHATRNFHLELDGDRLDLSGRHTLVIEADAACSSAATPLAPDLRFRTYDVDVTQSGAQVTVRGTKFGEFRGRTTPGGATFELTTRTGYYGPSFDFNEDLIQNGSLRVVGTATTTGSSSALAGPLLG